MPANDTLISTKFHVPSASAGLIPRPQLFQLLEQGLSQPLTLISAPPGFGKTMLVAGWIRSRVTDEQFNICWLSLDERDNESGTFWRYFVASIQHDQPKVGEMAQAMLASPALPDLSSILGALINELAALDGLLLIVLDDYHLIHSPDIHNNLSFFIDHLPDRVHLFLLTREDPPLALARRRARRQMVEVRATDLRFDIQETTAFMNQARGLALTPQQIKTLDERTEGWVAGLQMAALSLQGRDARAFFESFRGDDRYIADYLIEEVLQRQTAPVRDFLLKTSILERLSAPLCGALTGDPSAAHDYLGALERANLFIVPLDSHREWYRYHHLFADLLHQRLRETHTADEIAGLHRAASAWHESKGDIPAAVRHAHHIPDDARIMVLLEQSFGSFFTSNSLPQLFETARLIPPALRSISPALCCAVAWAGLATNHQLEVVTWLNAIETHFGIPAETAIIDPALERSVCAALLEVLVVRLQLPTQRTPDEQRAHILAIREQLNALPADQQCLLNVVFSLKPVIAFNLGLLAQQSGDITLASDAFGECLALSREQHNSTLFHLSIGQLASIQFVQGHLRSAHQTHEQALAEARRLGQILSPMVAISHAGLGWLHYEWNDLASAEHHFKEGLAQARLWNHWESLLSIALGRARLKQRAGDIGSALSILEELDSPPLEGMTLPLEAFAALLRARHADRDSASAWFAAKINPSSLTPNPTSEPFLLDVARLMAALDRPDDSIALIENVIHFAEAGGRTRTLIQAKAALANQLAAMGNHPEALACLMDALHVASPEGYISTFVDEGETIRQLLVEAKGRVPFELRTYVDQVLAGFSSGESRPAKRERGPASDLSEREKEILTLIAEGLSNQQIAGRLVISVTTVKTHVGNIFNKLGVTSRTQALARADGLGLLPRR